jgi:hypothetical protein
LKIKNELRLHHHRCHAKPNWWKRQRVMIAEKASEMILSG